MRRRNAIRRPLRSAVALTVALATGAFGTVPIMARTHRAPTSGTISGTIGPNAAIGPLPNLEAIRARAKIVVTTTDGSEVGVLAIGTARPDGAGVPRLPYTVSRLPLGVELRVAADTALTSVPSPIPSGFFYAFQLQKAYGSDPSLTYDVTLTPAHAVVSGFDFIAEPIEIPPALRQPGTAPSPSSS